MHFSVDSTSPLSPTDLLLDKVCFAVAAGRIKIGDRLPTVRAHALSTFGRCVPFFNRPVHG
jgi:DNA-binding transcriptional regulator YhcF (GntR family)